MGWATLFCHLLVQSCPSFFLHPAQSHQNPAVILMFTNPLLLRSLLFDQSQGVGSLMTYVVAPCPSQTPSDESDLKKKKVSVSRLRSNFVVMGKRFCLLSAFLSCEDLLLVLFFHYSKEGFKLIWPFQKDAEVLSWITCFPQESQGLGTTLGSLLDCE